jgi:hypothetical protein
LWLVRCNILFIPHCEKMKKPGEKWRLRSKSFHPSAANFFPAGAS